MNKQLQLFLLPFAGGNSKSFTKLVSLLDNRIDSYTVEYSGRMSRREEGYILDYTEFLKDVSDQISIYKSERLPYALLGYSLGSVLIYDLLIHSLISGRPEHLFVCAKGSLRNKTDIEPESKYSDDNVIAEMRYLRGTDERLLNNKTFLSIYMEPVKMDFNIWRQYVYTPGEIRCNATAIYSDKDPAARGVRDWEKDIKGYVNYYAVGDNHFFINENWDAVADIVNSNLSQYLV